MRKILLNWLGVMDGTYVKVYRGFGHAHRMQIYGHVLSTHTIRKPYRKSSILRNIRMLLGLFFVKPVARRQVQLKWGKQLVTTTTETDGFFRLEWSSESSVPAGEHKVLITCACEKAGFIQNEGIVVVPHITQLAMISDIDDTFLVSYSATRLRRLITLFRHNARTRKAFADVATHYQLLRFAQTHDNNPNPFFYVSSSEWNLYDYLEEFLNARQIPTGILLLNQLKSWRQLLKTGKTHHQGKFARIVRIMEAFPEQTFILLGDNSQQDPAIYASVAVHFPGRIHAVYIRLVVDKNEALTRAILQPVIDAGTPCCLFRESKTAILHSEDIGLISNVE
ncbi:App1 family protein [Filimonas effusa]|nr:phosphatase domain-containing protein [Filimonas effusa]